ncbi:MAG: hypothetical protein PHT12_02575 [Patescibacteria group bacterium]|nr:hypothetical protein [Patescibacteria group bacterium]
MFSERDHHDETEASPKERALAAATEIFHSHEQELKEDKPPGAKQRIFETMASEALVALQGMDAEARDAFLDRIRGEIERVMKDVFPGMQPDTQATWTEVYIVNFYKMMIIEATGDAAH